MALERHVAHAMAPGGRKISMKRAGKEHVADVVVGGGKKITRARCRCAITKIVHTKIKQTQTLNF